MQMKSKVRTNFPVLLVSLIVFLIPLIVFMNKSTLAGALLASWTGEKEHVDFFSYYKSIWFVILTLCLLIMAFMFYMSKKVDIKFSYIHIPLAVYFVFVVISTIFSKYDGISLWGFVDRREGFLAILGYIIICVVTSLFISDIKDFKLLFKFLIASALIISILGITQFFGFDFLQTSAGKHLILPASYSSYADSLKFNFPTDVIYATLYNPNYVGSYFSMLFPISLALFILINKPLYKIVFGIISCFTFVGLIGSRSSTGYIATFVAIIFLLILLRKSLIKQIRGIVLLFIPLVLLFVLLNYSSGGAILSDLGINFNKTTSTELSSPKDTIPTTIPTVVNVEGISINKFTLNVKLNTESLIIEYSTNSSDCKFKDSSGKVLEYKLLNDEGNKLSFINTKYSGVEITLSTNIINFKSANTTFNVIVTKDDGFMLLNPAGNPINIIDSAPNFGFKGNEMWGSSRGYIWSRSIPLVKDTLLVGHGPDTFSLYFPQNEVNAKLNYLGAIQTIVDKPHSLYLQMAINTGLVSLIAFLIFVIWYLLGSFKLYIAPKYTNEYYIPGICCTLAVIGFLVSSIANDSTVSISPIFWTIIGAGIACNRLFSKQLNQPSGGKKAASAKT